MLFRDSVSLGLISEKSIANLVIGDLGGLLGRPHLLWNIYNSLDLSDFSQNELIQSKSTGCGNPAAMVLAYPSLAHKWHPKKIAPDKQCRLDS